MSRRPATLDVFRAIADPTRRRILDLLDHEEQPVTDLAREFDVTLSAISQHLSILRHAGLVSERQIGRNRLYSLNATALKEVSDWIVRYERFWQERLETLGDELEENP